MCPASYVLAPVLSTLFSLGHNPDRTESIYTISQISLRYLLILSSTYSKTFQIIFSLQTVGSKKILNVPVSHTCYKSRQ